MTESNPEMMQVVLEAVAEVNRLLPPEQQVPTAAETLLAAEGGHLDSMGVVNLIVALDAALARRFGTTLSITEDMTLFGDAHPLETIGSLAACLKEKLERVRAGGK